MNKFSYFLLGSTALTLASLGPASALTIEETSDFGDTFSTRTILGPAPSGSLGIIGSVNSDGTNQSSSFTDHLDFFTLTGLASGQNVNISVRGRGGFDESFAINMLSDSGSFLSFAGDSGLVAPTGSGQPQSPATFATASTDADVLFDFDATALTSGELNFRITGGVEATTRYIITVTPEASTSID
jgi:hypothetical protein